LNRSLVPKGARLDWRPDNTQLQRIFVGRAPDQAGYQLACTEVWGGNNIADELLKLPGLVGLVHSKPVEPATSGGDVYYVSVCDKRVLSRVVLADVAGHEAVARISTRLRMLVKKYINTFDQSALMREINEAFYRQNADLAQYATAVLLSHDCRTGELIFASAGHPPTLWYHASQKEWGWLHERTTDSVKTFEGLPLDRRPDSAEAARLQLQRCGVGRLIALFGIAVETGAVMVVYLHEALDHRLKSGVPCATKTSKQR
jgi:hypothetical protein